MNSPAFLRGALRRRLLGVIGSTLLAAPLACSPSVVDSHNGNGGAGGTATSETFGGGAPRHGSGGACSLTSTGVSSGTSVEPAKQRTECIAPVGGACPSLYNAPMYIVPSEACTDVRSVDCGCLSRDGQCCYLVPKNPPPAPADRSSSAARRGPHGSSRIRQWAASPRIARTADGVAPSHRQHSRRWRASERRAPSRQHGRATLLAGACIHRVVRTLRARADGGRRAGRARRRRPPSRARRSASRRPRLRARQRLRRWRCRPRTLSDRARRVRMSDARRPCARDRERGLHRRNRERAPRRRTARARDRPRRPRRPRRDRRRRGAPRQSSPGRPSRGRSRWAATTFGSPSST